MKDESEGGGFPFSSFLLPPFGEVGMHETPRARLFAYGMVLLAPAVTLLVRWPADKTVIFTAGQ